MKINKKGVEITMTTVIIAVIVLIVLALSIYLLVGGFSGVNKGTACVKAGGVCKLDCGGSTPISTDPADACGSQNGRQKSCCALAEPTG
jgi:hypothetical protein